MLTSSKDGNDSISTAIGGFTLMELLVVISIVGVLSALAVPSFSRFIQGERADALNTEFAGAVLVARSTAIQTGTPTIFCGSGDSASCNGDWSSGWIVFRDDDRDSAKGADEDFILRRNDNTDRATLEVTSDDGTSLSMVRFNYRGSPGGELSVVASSGDQTRAMTVTPFGKPRIHD